MPQKNSHLSPRIVEMRAAGATYREIKQTLGVSHKQVMYWCNPRERERRIEEVQRRNERRQIAGEKLPPKRLPPEEKAKRSAERKARNAIRRTAELGIRRARAAARRAASRGIGYSLSEERIIELGQQTHCAVTDIRFEDYGDFVMSLDRLNPFEGYTDTNVQAVCWMYNRAKGSNVHEAVLHMARALVANNEPFEWD